jgi:hypothetical protein
LRREKPLLRVAEVGPAQGGHFELGGLPAVVARGGTLDGAVGDFVGGVGAGCGEREGGLEEDVGFVPVDVVVDDDGVGVGGEGDVLHEVGALPGAFETDGGAHGAVLDELDGVDLVDEAASADVEVPGSMFQAS